MNNFNLKQNNLLTKMYFIVIALFIIASLVYFCPIKSYANSNTTTYYDSNNVSNTPNFTDLEEFLHYMYWFYTGGYHIDDTIIYDSSNPIYTPALTNYLNITHCINDTLCCVNLNKYPISNAEKGTSNDSGFDPLNKIPNNWPCTKIKEDSIRWILGNILNCSQDSINTLLENYERNESGYICYRYGGYLYHSDGGKGGPWPNVVISSCFYWKGYWYVWYNFKQSFGYYSGTKIEEYRYTIPICAKLSIKNVDGKDYWTMHYASTEEIHEYIYPEWFSIDTMLYNNQLSKFCAECSDKIEQSQESVESYLRKSGFYNFKYYSKEIDFLGSHKVAVFELAHRKITINGEEKTLLFIICRGTKDLFEAVGDWARGNDQNFCDEQISNNVYEFEENVYNGLVDYANIFDLNNIEGSNLKIIITGHSLGGATANAVSAKMNYETGKDTWWLHRINKSNVYSYTFGAINVLSDIKYTDKNTMIRNGYENIHNVYNAYDTYGPQGAQSYHGVSYPGMKFGHTDLFELKKDETGSAIWDSTNGHNMATYLEAIDNQSSNEFFINLHCCKNSENEILSWILSLLGLEPISE